MHTYTQNGDLMYDPMIVLEVDPEAKTATAVEFEQSNPPLYQRIDEDGDTALTATATNAQSPTCNSR
jgi:hypothetical protein